ncbi:MAG TPA: MlaD family protein [Verrucomicrobiae bacterium]|nr:MlaD family protein [Verrucomicrobiae bacterium]
MSQSRHELKVGVFVLVCLILVAILLLQFSKGITIFRPTKTIILTAGNIGGLKPRASVLMSGVQVGTVADTKLSPEGTNVSIFLKIYSQYIIRSDARFIIEQSGFLGDQYVAIYPGMNQGTILTNYSVAHAEEPFNLLAAARSANGFIERMDGAAKKLDDAINDVRRLVLNEKTLTNLSFTVSTLRQVSEDASTAVGNLNGLITSNAAGAGTAVTNLVLFTEDLRKLAGNAQSVLTTNAPELSMAVSNLQTSTAMLTNLLGEAEAGRGLAGALFKNQQLAGHVSILVSNLAVSSENLNRLGLWHFLWYHPKPPKTNAAPARWRQP